VIRPRLIEHIHRRRIGGILAAVALVASLASISPAQANNVRVSHDLFGMHDGSLTSLDLVDVGSLRLWDMGVQWQDVETSPGHYNWSRLDQIVTAAQQAHVKVTMVVAMTPHFYRADPTKPPKNLQHYRDFVKALMRRYRSFNGQRGIDSYQVWNEANVVNFWSGTPRQMAQLTASLWKVRNHFDRGAKVIAPPMTTRFLSQLGWMQRYDRQRIGGKPVWRYYDNVALNLYPQATYRGKPGLPEDAMDLLALARKRLSDVGVPRSKPIWNTEVNYGLKTGSQGGHHAKSISMARQAAYVIRTYVLNAAFGVKRVYWYRYDMGTLPAKIGGGTIGNTQLSAPGHPARVTKAGRAFQLAQQWLHGRLIGKGGLPCQADVKGTYTCVVKDSTGTRRIYWNPTRRATVKLAAGARRKQTEYGAVSRVQGHTLSVDYRPVMVDSKRP
jgi:hypothetical protein